jgi:GNAT superfamily N-acetyltransferase
MELCHQKPELTYNLDEMDLDLVSRFILNSYWGKSLTGDQIRKSFRGSSCAGLLVAGQQIGFGRAISDGATSAYLKDIIVFDAFQGKGFGRLLMRGLFEHPDLDGVPNWYLGTKDAHGFYKSMGFRMSPDGIYMYLRI